MSTRRILIKIADAEVILAPLLTSQASEKNRSWRQRLSVFRIPGCCADARGYSGDARHRSTLALPPGSFESAFIEAAIPKPCVHAMTLALEDEGVLKAYRLDKSKHH